MVITINQIANVLYRGDQVTISNQEQMAVEQCYRFLERFAADKVIYGINTGFGPMAQWRVDDAYLEQLQYNIIRSHATGMGDAMPDEWVMAAMMARLGSLLQGKSGIHMETVTLLEAFINRRICPFIPMHGSVGASGDLVQLAHIALCLIGEGRVHYHNEWHETAEVMRENDLQPLTIHIREGLSLTNGTSVMTGIAAVNQLRAEQLLRYATLAAVWMNEIAGSYDDWMAEPLQRCRQHDGQERVAAEMRRIAEGSQCLKQREHALYDHAHREEKVFKDKVQAYYSLRCTPQILGPIDETLATARRIIEDELRAASDNPIIDPETQNVYHGGNFHGDYISLEQDKVKMVMTRLSMTAERQLNYLMNDRVNGILPPFLNRGVLGLNYGMQACQFTATSTTAESQTLSMPNYVHSIPNNNDNQDIVSMGTNSAELCARVIDNTYQVMAILFVAMAEATDLLAIKDKLACGTRCWYDAIRRVAGPIADTPHTEMLERVKNLLEKEAKP